MIYIAGGFAVLVALVSAYSVYEGWMQQQAKARQDLERRVLEVEKTFIGIRGNPFYQRFAASALTEFGTKLDEAKRALAEADLERSNLALERLREIYTASRPAIDEELLNKLRDPCPLGHPRKSSDIWCPYEGHVGEYVYDFWQLLEGENSCSLRGRRKPRAQDKDGKSVCWRQKQQQWDLGITVRPTF
jgi:hypothetical protein